VEGVVVRRTEEEAVALAWVEEAVLEPHRPQEAAQAIALTTT